MSSIDFDKFDLDGLSLETIEDKIDEQPREQTREQKSTNQAELTDPVNVSEVRKSPTKVQPEKIQVKPEQAEELIVAKTQSETSGESMTCPKCELQQVKAEQCSGCGVYVEKALAQIGQSNIQITAVKF